MSKPVDDGEIDYLYIQQYGPVFYIPHIVFDAFFHFF